VNRELNTSAIVIKTRETQSSADDFNISHVEQTTMTATTGWTEALSFRDINWHIINFNINVLCVHRNTDPVDFTSSLHARFNQLRHGVIEASRQSSKMAQL